MDRLLREGNPPVGQLASPVPQYKRPGSTDYEAVEGQHGAPFAILKDASGNIVSPATDAKLEQVKTELELVKSELQTIKANQLSGDQKVQLSGTLVSYQGALDITAGSSVSVLERQVAKGTIKKIMVRSGNATTYSIKLRLFAMTYTPYAEEIIAENRAGSQGLQLYEVDIVVPRYTLIFQNTGVADFYGYWSITEVL